jgi:hypothetical protein
MLRLKSLTFDKAPRIPGVRPGDMTSVDCDNPTTPLAGWQICIRPTVVYFVSPPGWAPVNASQPGIRDAKGPVEIHEVPRSNVYLSWTGDTADVEIALKGGKYDSAPLGTKPAEPTSILGQLPLPLA